MTRAWLGGLLLLACSSSATDGTDPNALGGAGGAGGAGGSERASVGGNTAIGGNVSAAGSPAANGGAAASAANGGAGAGGASAGMANGGAAGSAGGGSAGGGSAGVANDGAAGSAGGAGQSATTGTIVPLYTDPSDASWTAIATAKQAHRAVEVIAIVNPNSGPGAHADAGYTSGIAKLLAAGIVPIGYVSTAYTARGASAVKADIDSWKAFYPRLSGIFFDEQSNQAGDDTFYRDVSAYAKSQGLAFTVGNPGTSVPTSYLGALDVMLIYEEKGLPQLTSLAANAPARLHYGIIPYGAAFDAAFVSAAKADVAYVYATSDDLPNPWDTLTPYFNQLLDGLSP